MKREIQATTVIKAGKLTAIASTEDKDSAGDVLRVRDWDFKRFNMNPVLQAGHNYAPQFTIGRAENLRIEENKVLFDPVFHEITPLAKQIKKMYEEGFLKAWSVGFIPGTRQLKGEDEGTLNELLEVSAVAVPANAYALMKGFEKSEDEIESELKEWMGVEDSEEKEVDEVAVEQKEVVESTTGESEDHTHTATYDDETGDGSTDEVDGHTHDIVNFEVQEADGHTHTLTVEEVEDEDRGYGNGMKPKKKPKKKKEHVERWNKQLPEAFNKEFDVQSIDNIRMSFQNEIFTKFFDCEVKHLFVNNYHVPSPLVGTYLSSFKENTKDFELTDTRNWHGDFEYPPLYEVVQLNSKTSEEFLLEGIQFFKVAGKNRVALKWDVGWQGIQVSIITDNDSREWNKELLTKVHKWSFENNYLRGEKFALNGAFLPASNKTWDDVILDKGIKDVVQRAITKTLSADAGSRGLLMIGPPGTGKTMTGKIMKDMSDATFIWVSAQDMYYIGASWAIKLAFDMARDLGPATIFMEDIDEWLRDGKAIDVLKTEMDGILENKGLITVLTSNHPEQLPDALLDRPGRFHEILKFGLPSAEVRKNMLLAWLGEEIAEEKMAEFVEATEGYSGAYMKEVVEYAKTISEDEELSLVDALMKSLEKVQEQKELINEIRQTTKGFDTIELKEGRVISKKNRTILTSARDALNAVLEMEAKDTTSEEDETVKGMKEFVPAKKEVLISKVGKKRKMNENEITLKVLQEIAKVANNGLHQAKKIR